MENGNKNFGPPIPPVLNLPEWNGRPFKIRPINGFPSFLIQK